MSARRLPRAGTCPHSSFGEKAIVGHPFHRSDAESSDHRCTVVLGIARALRFPNFVDAERASEGESQKARMIAPSCAVVEWVGWSATNSPPPRGVPRGGYKVAPLRHMRGCQQTQGPLTKREGQIICPQRRFSGSLVSRLISLPPPCR